MEEGISCVLSESRIIADLSDFADFKMRNNRRFVIIVLSGDLGANAGLRPRPGL